MPTIVSHIAVPLALRLGLGAQKIPVPLLCAGIMASILPDADVLAFRFGIPYADTLGHRGMTHSIGFAFVLSMLALIGNRPLRCTRWTAFMFVFVCTVSHPLLDALTNGGLGVALFWPFSNERYFLPWSGIEVSAIGRRFFSQRSIPVLYSELRWIWCPAFLLTGLLILIRRLRKSNP